MNVKEEFIEWIYKNSNPNLSSIDRDTISKNIDESNNFFDRDIMQVDESNYGEMMEYLKKELYKNNKAFQEYNMSIAKGRPRAILGKENYFMFLEEKFGSNPDKNVNYWIFQGSPEIYNIQEALKAGHLKSWKVAAHKDRINTGDKVIIWQTGKEAGCYALAEIVSEVGNFEDEAFEKQYYKITAENDISPRVKINITNNLADNPVLWEEIKELPEFENFNAGNQGTNFSATREEFETLRELGSPSSKSRYKSVKRKLDKNKVEEFLKILRQYVREKNLDPQDPRLAFNVRVSKSSLAFLIGMRYVLHITISNDKTIFSFVSPDIISPEYGSFHNKKGEIETHWNTVDDIQGYEEKVKEGFDKELARDYKSPFRRFTDPEFVKDVFGRNAGRKSENNQRKYWLYSPGENAEHWEEFYGKGIMGLGWDNLGDLNQYSSKNEIVKKLQEMEGVTSSKKNDATATFEFKEVLSKGDIVIAKKGSGKLLGYGEVVSDYYYDNERNIFRNCRKMDWKKKGVWETGFPIVHKTLTDITQYATEDPNFDKYYERLLNIMDGGVNAPKNLKTKLPLNQILYGPPGTGKTYQLQDTYFKEFTVQETSLNREQFLENIVSDLKWWQVAAIALLDLKKSKVTDMISHELFLIKIKLSNSKNPNATIWGYLQHYTDPECENVKVATRSSNPIFYKDENSYWEVKEDLLEQFYPEAYSILEEVKNYHPNPDKSIKNYEFVTFHQSFSYEDFIEGIKPNLDDEENNVSYRIEDGIFKKMCLKADADRENRYAIFIDEINRGNVSAIFGELITLIEDDKRLGEVNELRAKLPYSKTDLGVPPNLHIFGTMNTADRSVEALDSALRRRFTFKEIMPEPELLSHISFNGFDLQEILKTINLRIEALLDRDHTIGHSYFIKISSGDTGALKQAFENKIIPLLQEYFYHDYEKIALILGEGFIERKEGAVKFARFKQLEDPEITSSYELKKNIEDIEAALRKLLNRKDEEAE